MSEETQAEGTEEKKEKQKGVIEVTSKKTDRSVEFEKTFGNTVEEAVELFGSEVVFTNFNQQCVIKCQAKVRGILDKGGTPEDAIAAGQNYTPGVVTRTRSAKDPVAQLAAAVASGDMSREELQAKLEEQLAALNA